MLNRRDCFKQLANNQEKYLRMTCIRPYFTAHMCDEFFRNFFKFRGLYIKTELFYKRVSDEISSLFRISSASDYDDFYVISKQDAVRQSENAKDIVKLILTYLKTNKKAGQRLPFFV